LRQELIGGKRRLGRRLQISDGSRDRGPIMPVKDGDQVTELVSIKRGEEKAQERHCMLSNREVGRIADVHPRDEKGDQGFGMRKRKENTELESTV